MGDRGNIFFVDARDGKRLAGVYMYAHWSGSTIWNVVRTGLERGRERWGDTQYLARILFCELVRDAVLDTTGYGLGTGIGDNEHAIVRVDDDTQRVSFHEPGKERDPKDKGAGSWSYEAYLAAPLEELERAFIGPAEAEPLPKATAKKKKPAKKKPAKKAKPTRRAR